MNRIKSLDALRGLAALSVVFAHIHGIFFSHHIFLDLTPLRIIWEGGEAVILFFVLSGFVLSAPYCQTGNVPYGRFIGARMTRIYLPYIASIAICLFLSLTVFDPAAASSHQFLTKRWPHPIEFDLLLSHVALIGNFDTTSYNEVIWSLVHELRFALIFPIFIWVMRSLSWKQCLLITAFMSLTAALANANLDQSMGFKNSYLHSAHYLLFFMMGGLLVKNLESVGSWLLMLSSLKKKIILALGLFLYMYSFAISAFPRKMHWNEIAQFNDLLGDWGIGIASVIFILLAIHSERVSKFLNKKSFLFLGKVSYSLYLVHIPVLAAALYIFGNTPEIITVAIAFPFIFLTAIIFYNFVELPAHKLGKRYLKPKTRLQLGAQENT